MENRNNRKTAFDTLKSGVWMNGFDEALGPALERCENLCFRLNALPPSEKTEREALIREILGDIGTGGILHSPFRCDMGFNIHIGNNFTGNFNITILDEADVTIGDNVFIGPNTTLCTIIHAYDAERRNAGIMRPPYNNSRQCVDSGQCGGSAGRYNRTGSHNRSRERSYRRCSASDYRSRQSGPYYRPC